MYENAWALIERAQKYADALLDERSDSILLSIILAAAALATMILLRRGRPAPAPRVRVLWNHDFVPTRPAADPEDHVLWRHHAERESGQWRE